MMKLGLLIAAVIFMLVASAAGIILAAVDVNVCHATGSHTNPYNLIVVSVNSVDNANGLNGHGDHVDDAWKSYIFDGVTYPGQNEGLFGTLINDDCSLIQAPTPTSTFTLPPPPTATATPTATEVPPTATPTDTSVPTATNTGIPPTSTPTTDPSTPVPTTTATPEPPTATPYPPRPAVQSNTHAAYPGEKLGDMFIGKDKFALYQGVKAEDGSLMLPSASKGAALYNNVIWMHRLWKSGWITVELGQKIIVNGQRYQVIGARLSDYGVYPNSTNELMIATCYRDNDDNWKGVVFYRLKLIQNSAR